MLLMFDRTKTPLSNFFFFQFIFSSFDSRALNNNDNIELINLVAVGGQIGENASKFEISFM